MNLFLCDLDLLVGDLWVVTVECFRDSRILELMKASLNERVVQASV